MKVVILHDRVPDDAPRDDLDALVQVEAVSRALTALGHEPTPLALDLDLGRAAGELARLQPGLVFNVTESLAGHGRLIHVATALLDALRLRYTGATTEAMFITSHKLLAKQMLKDAGIATPPWFGLNGDCTPEPCPPGRYIVKSVWEHASRGMDDAAVQSGEDPVELTRRLGERAAMLGGNAFVETFIDGREFNLSLLEGDRDPEVLPPAEIEFAGYPPGKPRIVGYAAKWDDQSFEYHATPRRFEFPANDGLLLGELASLALRCWRLFGLRGYGRVDFRVDADGRPWVLEINTNPCLSPDAGFFAAAQQAGLTYEQVIARIVAASSV